MQAQIMISRGGHRLSELVVVIDSTKQKGQSSRGLGWIHPSNSMWMLFSIVVAARNSKIALRFALARSCARTVLNTFPTRRYLRLLTLFIALALALARTYAALIL